MNAQKPFRHSVVVSATFGLSLLLGSLVPGSAQGQQCLPPPNGWIAWWPAMFGATNLAGGVATPLGGVSYGQGKVGPAFVLNGGAHLRIPSADLRVPTNALTIEAWVFPTAQQQMTILSQWDTVVGRDQRSYGFGLDSSLRPGMNLSPDGTELWWPATISPTPVPLNQWSHVAGTYDGAAIRIYVNGQLTVEKPYTNGIFATSTSDIAIGGAVGGSEPGNVLTPFSGSIDELTVYKRALNPAEIEMIFRVGIYGKCQPPLPIGNECAPMPESIVSWWRGDGSPIDTIGTNRAESVGVSYVPADFGQAFSFDGTNSYLAVPASGSLDVGLRTGLTIELWIKPSTLDHQQALFEYNDGQGKTGVHLFISIPDLGGVGSIYANIVDREGVSHYFASDPGLLRTYAMQHVALTYDRAAGIGKIYLNGNVVAEKTLGSFVPRTSYPVYIGKRPSGVGVPSLFAGQMDEVTLYGSALSNDQIGRIYKAFALNKCIVKLPEIAIQPQSASAVAGSDVTFGVYARGTEPLAYQWFKNDILIAGATRSILVLSNVQPAMAGSYVVRVSNKAGLAFSTPAVLTVVPVSNCAPVPQGLVAWWKAEGNFLDRNGRLPYVPATTPVHFESGKVGQAFYFNGASDSLTNSSPGLTNIVDNYTMEFWAYPTAGRATTSESLEGIQGISDQRYAVFPLNGMLGTVGSGVSVGTNGVSVFEHGYVYLSSLLVKDTPITGWTHIAVTYSNRQPSLYINGTLVRTGLRSTRSSCPSTWLGENGLDSHNYGYYAGKLDEYSIYSRQLTDVEIRSVYAAGSMGKCEVQIENPVKIVSHPASREVRVGTTARFEVLATGDAPLQFQWRFNGFNISGATQSVYTIPSVKLSDAGNYSVLVQNNWNSVVSSNAVLRVLEGQLCVPMVDGIVGWWRGQSNAFNEVGNLHGQIVGNVRYAPGRVGTAFQFDGTGDAVKIGTNSLLQLQSFTIEGWIKREAVNVVSYGSGGNGIILGYGAGGFGLFMNSTGRLVLSKIAVGDSASVFSITDTNWHYVAVTKSGIAVVFYMDGVAVGAPSIYDSFEFTTPLAIGARGDNLDNSFLGRVDEIALYSRALSVAELDAIYKAGELGKCLPPGKPPVIVQQPVGGTIQVGQSFTFAPVITGAEPLKVQWYVGDRLIPGATSAQLTITNAQLTNSGAYSFVVSNAVGYARSIWVMLNVTSPARVVSVQSVTATAGTTVSVPILLAANGGENALSFSLSYPTSRLAFVDFETTDATAGAAMFVNTNQVGQGRAGVALALPAGQAFHSGTQAVATALFTTVPNPQFSSSALINFSNTPVRLELVDTNGAVLQAVYRGGAVTITGGGFEGDVTSDGLVTVADWVNIGRYAAGFRIPTNSGIFQRADVAPRSTSGDGFVSVMDWVQAGRYVAALDPLTPAGGPTSQVIRASTYLTRSGTVTKLDANPRQISIQPATLVPGETGTVNVKLSGAGAAEVNALGFTLKYDPSALSFVGAEPGSTVAGANLQLNTTEAAAGNVGIVMGLPAGRTFAPETQVAVLSFKPLNVPAGGVSEIGFTDQPAVREVVDPFAQPLAAQFIGVSVTIESRPVLRAERDADRLVLSWSTSAGTCELESSQDGTNWQPAGAAIGELNGEKRSVVPVEGAARFFRLRQAK